MSTNPDALGSAINAAIAGMSDSDKAVALKVWQSLSGPVASAIDAAAAGAGGTVYACTAWGASTTGPVQGNPGGGTSYAIPTQVGDVVVSVSVLEGPAFTAGNPSPTWFESTVTVAGQIQQVASTDLSTSKLLFVLRRG